MSKQLQSVTAQSSLAAVPSEGLHPQLAIFAELHRIIGEIPTERLPMILAQLAATQSAVAARLITGHGALLHPDPAAPLLNVDQVAERLQMVKSRVYELIRQGRLPAVRIGKHVRIDPGRLEQWIAKHRDGALDNATRAPRSLRPAVRD